MPNFFHSQTLQTRLIFMPRDYALMEVSAIYSFYFSSYFSFFLSKHKFLNKRLIWAAVALLFFERSTWRKKKYSWLISTAWKFLRNIFFFYFKNFSSLTHCWDVSKWMGWLNTKTFRYFLMILLNLRLMLLLLHVPKGQQC